MIASAQILASTTIDIHARDKSSTLSWPGGQRRDLPRLRDLHLYVHDCDRLICCVTIISNTITTKAQVNKLINWLEEELCSGILVLTKK